MLAVLTILLVTHAAHGDTLLPLNRTASGTKTAAFSIKKISTSPDPIDGIFQFGTDIDVVVTIDHPDTELPPI